MDKFYNYEEALKNPLEVKSLVFLFNNSYHPYTTTLPDKRIKTLINLEKLYIGGFNGKHIDLPDEIEELKKLKDLSIYAENLVEIPKVIWKLKYLTALYLEITTLKEGELQLSNLGQLQSFGIKVKNSEILSESVFDNISITNFYIQSFDLQEIPNRFDQFVHLNTLRLHCQHLKKIPSTISTLHNLKRIDIYNKAAKSIDVQFDKLEKLEEFRWGQASFFPLAITDAKNLKRATFDVSYFEAIDTDALVFQNLQIFDLSFCKLKGIPKCFETLETIQGLYLTHSDFKEIEFDFQKLTNLAHLSFKRAENFGLIDMRKFMDSLMTIKNLKSLKTPLLSKGQDEIRKDYKFEFEWMEE